MASKALVKGRQTSQKNLQEEPMKILLSSHLSGKAEEWYDDLEIDDKGSWPTLVKHFETYYQLTPRDARTKLFDLRMKLADLKQQTDESIADYLEGAANLVSKFPTEEFDIGMAIVREINDREHQEWIERECHRMEDFTFTSVSKLVGDTKTRT